QKPIAIAPRAGLLQKADQPLHAWCDAKAGPVTIAGVPVTRPWPESAAATSENPAPARSGHAARQPENHQGAEHCQADAEPQKALLTTHPRGFRVGRQRHAAIVAITGLRRVVLLAVQASGHGAVLVIVGKLATPLRRPRLTAIN